MNKNLWTNRSNYGPYVDLVDCGCDFAKFNIRDPYESGSGMMLEYQLFPGIYLMLYDLHMKKAIIDFDTEKDVRWLAVDYCKEGAIEIEMYKDYYTSIHKRETCIDRRHRHGRIFSFQNGCFVGMSLSVKISEACPEISKQLGGLHINLEELFEKLCPGEKPFIVRDDRGMEKILLSFFDTRHDYPVEHCRLKALELFMYLQEMDVENLDTSERSYFDYYNVNVVRNIHALITSTPEKHFSLQELSAQFDISLTAMKKCFKEMYGDSLYSYTKRYKMNHAARYLENNRRTSINELSRMYGYESPGKFSLAFKDIMGMTPAAYKRLHEDCDFLEY